MLHGRKVEIKLDGNRVAGALSCDINADVETIETSSPTTGTYRTYIVGRKGWSVKMNHLIPENADTIKGMLTSWPGSQFTLSIVVEELELTISGTAICTGVQLTAAVGSLAKGAFSFQGSGPLT